MKINEELSVLFWLFKAKKTKDGMIPIYVRITIKGVREDFSSGKKIQADLWDDEYGKAKPSCPDAKQINSYIRKTQVELEKHFERLKGVDKEVTPKMVREAYQPAPVAKKTLMQAFVYHNTLFAQLVEKGKGSAHTLKRYDRLKTKVADFLLKKFKVDDIALEEIEYATATKFYHYLLMNDIDENTAMKYVKTLKQVIKKAVDHGWIKYNPIAGFKCPYKDPDRDYLEMKEVLAIYKKDFEIERVARVRDVYIFCCFTGFAYETVYSLQHDNIFTGVDGRPWITKDRAKSGTEETVPLLPIAQEIIEKYRDHPYCIENDKLLPVNCNQRYNSYLKEIADLCGIKKNLTTHTARHTFATTITLENDVPIETVSKMLGHKDIRTTQIYAKITKRKMSNNMKALQDKLFCENGFLRSAL